jgi:carboxyl-terminal processing protease
MALTVAAFSAAGQSVNYRNEATQLVSFLTKVHVEPRKIDDKFSSDVYNLILHDLDPDKVIFTEEDVLWLNAFQTTIDDELTGKNWAFLTRLTERYESSLKRNEFLTTEILHAPINRNMDESIDEFSEKWMKDEAKLRTRLRMMLKLKVLEKIWWMMERDSTEDPEAAKIYVNDASELVKKIELRTIANILHAPQGFESYVASIFIKAIAAAFDPHTVYFSTTEFENFKHHLNTEGYYFGFTLDDKDDGRMTIIALAPGGPAWKSGEIQVSDVIVAVKTQGDDPIELEGLSIDEVNALLDNVTERTLEFTIRKANGIQKTITLKKEKIQAEENFVRSFILQGETKAGYIHLPDFYTQWGDSGEGSRCANDVAREIIKLKRDGIQSLILDLRFNGGGSLEEALAMAGIFIDQGALAMIKDNKGAVTVLKDINRGTIYDGPLVLMVNGFSASASEILAAALQDYNRAIIVGSRTFGKATGQNIFPLNLEHTPDVAFQKNEAFVKITTERLYRVTGGSLQAKGVKPDIELPDIFTVVHETEGKNPFSLKSDSVIKNSFYKPLPQPPRSELRAKSIERLKGNNTFSELTTAYQNLSAYDSVPHTSLRWTEFVQRAIEKKNDMGLITEEYQKENSNFVVVNNSTEASRLITDQYAAEYNKVWIEKLIHDIYLSETFNIVNDYTKYK